MGLFDFVKRAGRSIYRAIKKPAKKVLAPIVRGARTVARVVSTPLDAVNERVKSMLDKIKNVPVLGDIAKGGVTVSRKHPVLGKIIRAIEGSSAGVDALEAFGKGDDDTAKEKLKQVGRSASGKTGRRILQIAERI